MKDRIKSILLVDDSENDVRLIKSALENHNLANKIVVAEDGEEALDYLYKKGKFSGIQHTEPILILLDIKMPLMNGIEVLKLIRSDKQFDTIPVVMVTASQNPNDLQECYDSGANSYITKPIKINEFIKVIKQLGNYWAIINNKPVEKIIIPS